jgi:hypothetical protein
MALTPEQMQTACEMVGWAPSLRDAAAQWRARYPAIRALPMDAMDLRDETPSVRLGARRIYLAASQGHCWRITQQPEEANVLILTQE